MQQLIDEVFDIIKDYRSSENLMTKERILEWVNQFEVNDRVFLLEETKNILAKRYISEEKANELIKGMISFLAKRFEYDDPKDFLLDSSFIDIQPEGKSQKELLKFVDEIIFKEYGIRIADCNPEIPKYYLYIDDVLCTGDTLVKNMTRNTDTEKGWFNITNEDGNTNFDVFMSNRSKLVLIYFSIHEPNVTNAKRRIYYEMGKQNVDFTYAWEEEYAIDKSNNVSSKYNYIHPIEDETNELVIQCKEQIESKIHDKKFKLDEVINYRGITVPNEETLFTSSDNRNRYEKIILNKCIELYNSSTKLKNDLRPRPLGYGLYSDMNFGFGTLIFTWRNVPYNVPLVFWYKNNSWISLFERNHT